MLKSNSTEDLLGLKDVIVDKIEDAEKEKHIYIHMPQRLHFCPKCNHITSKIHDYRTQTITDLPIGGKNVVLHLRKRRHKCSFCGKKFDEFNDFVQRYGRFTSRVFMKVLEELKEVRSIKSVATSHGMSIPTASKVLKQVEYTPLKLPEVISIDEFKGNAGGEKFQCILTDAKDHKVFDILPNRKQEDLLSYFSEYRNKNDVKYIITDMNLNFKTTLKLMFPKATVVIDRYHYMRQVDFALEHVRKEEQKRLSKVWRLYFKQSRSLLIKDSSKLTTEEHFQLNNMFMYSEPLYHAYQLKKSFELFKKSTTREDAARRLGDWVMHAQASKLEPFIKVTQTFARWQTEILNSFDVPYTNGYTEGCNNRIKVIKRVSFGMPNFNTMRKRILHTMIPEI